MAGLLPQQATSAIVVALAFAAEQAARLRIPRGFGFVVPPVKTEEHPLLACTFVDQKFSGRVPAGAVLLRAFFGGHSGEALLGEADDQLIERARSQLSRVLGPCRKPRKRWCAAGLCHCHNMLLVIWTEWRSWNRW